MRTLLISLFCLLPLFASDPTWKKADADAILEKTLKLDLSPDLSHLNDAEKACVAKLMKVGDIMHDLYLDATHPEGLKAAEQTNEVPYLADLYWLFKGPIATTLDNERKPFLDVAPESHVRNMYPAGTTADALADYIAKNPKEAEHLLHPRSVVRKADAETLKKDLAMLDAYPHINAFHPNLRRYLESRSESPDGGFYGLPYSARWPAQHLQASRLLHEAADVIADTDPDFADYLHLRARDLLSDNYEGGDAAWITGSFKRINAQIGAYETYDDLLRGTKAFFSLSLLVRDEKLTNDLQSAIQGLQELQDSLPYKMEKKVRENIPVGVYQVVADYGQARGTNTATILPNESHIARKYGRTILLRHNVLTNPELYKITDATWKKAVVDKHHDDLTMEANFYRTLWHEIGHYLGPSRTKDDRPLAEALGKYTDLMEELKADLVSLYSVKMLAEKGVYTDAQVKAIYAGGIYRTLQKNRPRRTQPYQSMQLMQMNFYLATPMLTFRPGSDARLEINYDHYHETIKKMLKLVLKLQHEGDVKKIETFINGYSIWHKWMHEELGKNLKTASPYRYRLLSYGAMK